MNTASDTPLSDSENLAPHITIDGSIIDDLLVGNLSKDEIDDAFKDGKMSVDDEGQEILDRLRLGKEEVVIRVLQAIAAKKIDDMLNEEVEKEPVKKKHSLLKVTELVPMLANLAPVDAATEIELIHDGELQSSLLPELALAVPAEQFSQIIGHLQPATKESITIGDLSADKSANLCIFPVDEVVALLKNQRQHDLISKRSVKNDRDLSLDDDKNYMHSAVMLQAVIDDHDEAVSILALLGKAEVTNILRAPVTFDADSVKATISNLRDYFDSFDWDDLKQERARLQQIQAMKKKALEGQKAKAAAAPRVDLNKKIDLDNI